MWLPSVLVSACLLAACVASAGRVRRQTEPPAECQDPRNQTGTCTTILDCPRLSWMIENGRKPRPAELNYLKNNICRATRSQLFLCCPPLPPQLPPPEDHPNKAILDEGSICGTYIDHRVRGGEEVPLGKHPWMAVLFYTDLISGKVEAGCGGALISNQHVLTAAHCVTNLISGVRLDSVRLGDHNLTSREDCQERLDGRVVCNDPQNFGIEKRFVHEDYNTPNDKDNDIALLKLDRPIVEDSFVGKICLPFGIVGQRDYTGVNLTVPGHGKTGPNFSSPSSDVLLEVMLPGVSQHDCRDIIKRHGATITDKQICAGAEHGIDSCGGDSGGPVIVAPPTGPPYSLIGVVSFGAFHCGEGGIPSVNTRVSEYLNWILDRLDD